jgi:hypothetical protein
MTWAVRHAGAAPMVLPVALALLLAGCSGGGSSGGGTEDYHRTAFAAADFVDPTASTNRYFPLKPGMQWVREGTTDRGSRQVPHQVVSTMTDVVREIDGVKALAMLDQDTDAGELAEASVDYFGLDKKGNVWLLGSYTADYSGGKFTNSADAWLGSSGDGKPGIQMPVQPDGTTKPWVVVLEPDGAGTGGRVDKTGEHKCVPFACYDDVLVVQEADIGGGETEFKYYAPEVGQILNTPRKDSRHQDQEALVNLTELSPAGLAEMSRAVQQLEGHARESSPDLFGDRSTRTG